MAGGQHADTRSPGHDGLELAERGRAVEVGGTEGDVACPVRPRSRRHFSTPCAGPVFSPHPPADPPVPTATLPTFPPDGVARAMFRTGVVGSRWTGAGRRTRP